MRPPSQEDDPNESAEEWAEQLEFPQGQLWLGAPAPGVLISRARGRGSVELARAITSFAQDMLERSPDLAAFHDFSAVSGYSPQTRHELVDWAARHDHRVRASHVLFGSKLMAMGLSLAAVVLGRRLITYSDPAAFEAEREREIARSRRSGL